MFTKLTHRIRKAIDASYGVKINAQNVLLRIHAETFAPFINCIIDDALPDIDHVLALQFIDLVDPLQLLHLAPYLVVNCIQICAVGWTKAQTCQH